MPSDQVNAMRRAQVLRGKQEALRVLRLAMIILSNRLRLCPTSSCQRFANHLARAYGLRLGYGLTEPISSISDSKASSGKLPIIYINGTHDEGQFSAASLCAAGLSQRLR